MNIIIKTKNIELTDYLENLINKKFGGLKKFVHHENAELFVEVEKETKHHKKGDIFMAEAIINLPGKKLTARFHCDDLLKSITETKKEMERELRKYKAQKIELPRRKAKKSASENF